MNYDDAIKALRNRLGDSPEMEKLAERVREIIAATGEDAVEDKRTYRLPYSSDPAPIGDCWS